MFLRVHFFGLCLYALPVTAATDQKIAVSSVVITSYSRTLSAPDNANAFRLDRAYIDIKAPIDKRFSLRLTTDVGPLSAGDTKIRPFVKYAYSAWATKRFTLRFGMAANGWTSLFDRFWEHRFVAKSFADRRRLIPSADLGLHASGVYFGKKLQLQGALVNGEGYAMPEVNDAKSAQLRVTYHPLNGATKLPFSVYLSQDFGIGDAHRALAAAALGFKTKRVTVWIEALLRRHRASNGLGYSAALLPSIGKLGHIISRIDRWDFSTAATPDRGQAMLAGLGRKYGKKVTTALIFAHEQHNNEAARQTLSVRVQTKF